MQFLSSYNLFLEMIKIQLQLFRASNEVHYNLGFHDCQEHVKHSAKTQAEIPASYLQIKDL
jgi:hypothetical protein